MRQRIVGRYRAGRPRRRQAAGPTAHDWQRSETTDPLVFVIVGRASDIEPHLIDAISHARTNRLLIDPLPRRVDLKSLARTLPRLKPADAAPPSDRRVLAATPSTECEWLAAEPDVLSKREVDVTKLLTRGMTNREIANKLFIAERTAEGHVERIRNKLGVRSRTEVALWAARRGLAE